MGEVYDWEDFAPEPIVFRVAGKAYELPAMPAKLGAELVTDKWAGKPVREAWVALLGPLWEQMGDDGVPSDARDRAGMVAMADGQIGRTYALHLLKTGSHPKAMEAAMAELGQETPPPTQEAAASTTPSRASGTGTKAPPKKAPAARRSAGARSSKPSA